MRFHYYTTDCSRVPLLIAIVLHHHRSGQHNIILEVIVIMLQYQRIIAKVLVYSRSRCYSVALAYFYLSGFPFNLTVVSYIMLLCMLLPFSGNSYFFFNRYNGYNRCLCHYWFGIALLLKCLHCMITIVFHY